MRLYRALLRLFPTEFREEYGDEMSAIFRMRARQTTGALPTLGLWAVTVEDIVRNAIVVHWDALQQDLRYAVRALARTPGFFATAILVTALGIGANTAAFSVADFVLVRPLPYAHADRLVKLAERTDDGTNQVSPALYQRWRTTSSSFDDMGAYYTNGVNLVGDGEPQRLDEAVVTASLLPTLGVQPLRGRLFTTADEHDGGTIILSYGLWQSRFGGADDVIGRRLLTDGAPREVIGVMPRDFRFPNRDVAFWTPMPLDQLRDEEITNTYWEVLGRLRPGTSVERARTEMDAVSRRIREQYPKELDGIGSSVVRLRDELSSQSRTLLLALCAAAACVLLIACANLASLLLARYLRRKREFLVRAALGAGRERLIRQCITESLVIAVLGGALGIALAIISVPLLTRLIPATLPIAKSPTIDGRIVLFAALLSTVTGVIFGALPAWRASNARDMSELREGTRAGGGQRERVRAALVVVEVTASVVLLVSAGLLLRALARIQATDPGFQSAHVLAVRTALPVPKYDSVTRRVALYEDVLREVRALPGVSSAAYISGLPLASGGAVWPVVPEGQESATTRPASAISRYVTPGYFRTLAIPLVRGRDVSDADIGSRPWAAVVSESFVRRYWPNEDPIGKRFKFLTDTRTVVGVVGDVRVRGLERTNEPQVYLSYRQVPDTGAASFFYPKELVIRSSTPPVALTAAVRRIVHRVDPDQPVSNVRTMDDIVSDVTAARATQVRVLGAFAFVAFLLAAVGIHGVLSYSVSSRSREIGVRMALGAQPRSVVRMVLRQAVVLAAAGVLPGVLLAYVAGRAMQGLLAGIKPADLETFGAVAVLCLVMTVAGSLAPALRAVRVDPATALRMDG
jgi:putative ABC transport system permease protein